MSLPHHRIADRCICCDSGNLAKSPAVLMPFVANRVFGWEPVEITAEWGLRDLKLGMAYPLCNTLQCRDCGVLFLDIRFDDHEMALLYGDYRGEAYTSVRDRFEPGYLARNNALLQGITYNHRVEDFIARHIPSPDSVLDWGGDTGLNTPFRGKCSTHHVYDISNKPVVENAECVGLETIRATHYDLITLDSVIEHVPYPQETLGGIKDVMREGSFLYMEVPFEEVIRHSTSPEGLCSRKKHWHEHVNFFTEASLTVMLAKCGFDIVALQTMPVSAGLKDAYAFSIIAKPVIG